MVNFLFFNPMHMLTRNRLQDETARVEDVLTKESAVDAIVDCFVTSKANSFENLLDPILKMCRLSKLVALGIAKPRLFLRLIDRLGHSKAVVRLNLLRLLKTICDVHPNRTALVEKYGLYEIVEKLSNQDGAVLVKELAREIMPSLAPVLRPATHRSVRSGELTPKPGLTPRIRPRRVASDMSSSSESGRRTSSSLSAPRAHNGASKTRAPKQRLGDLWGDGVRN